MTLLRPFQVAGLKLCIAVALSSLLPSCSTDDSDQQVAGSAKGGVPASDVDTATDRPIVVRKDGYVGSEACRSCHEGEFDKWHASYHRSMTQLAGPSAVVGDFDGTEIEIENKRYEFYRKDDEFRVKIHDLTAKDSPPVDKPFLMTTGSHHFQAYWLPSGNTRALEVFPALFRIDDSRWMPLAAQFLHPPGFYHDFNRAGAWNVTCNRCHATHPRPRIYDGENMDTHVAEFGISCESCHGPGAAHIDSVSANADDLAIVHPDKLTPVRSAQVCGSCHGALDYKTQKDFQYWVMNGFPYRPGDDLFKHRSVVESGDKQYWPDGMLRVSGREYNGLMGTPCFNHDDPSRQMTCTSCHQLHQSQDDPRPVKEWANDQLKFAMDSNRPGRQNDHACTQCHKEYVADDAIEAHTHHSVDSAGSRCYNCHMPHTTWGVMKAMRSHTVSNPSVQESLHPVGRPNACNLCHLDETLGWTAKHLTDWYGQESPELVSDQQDIAASVLWALMGDAGQRSLIAWSMGWDPARAKSGGRWMVPFLSQLLDDPYHVVRSTAHRSLAKIDGFADIEYDFMDPPEKRRAAQKAVMELWGKLQREGGDAAKPAALQNAQGALNQSVFDRLRGRRNDREVFLEE